MMCCDATHLLSPWLRRFAWLTRDAGASDASESDVDELVITIRHEETDAQSRAIFDLLDETWPILVQEKLSRGAQIRAANSPSICWPFHSVMNPCESVGIM